jgi:CBS domain-containing protein
MKVKDFMTSEVVSLNKDLTVTDAANLMIELKYSVIPIVDSEHHLVGIITESDFIGQDANIPHALASLKRVLGQISYFSNIEEIYEKAQDKPLRTVMTPNPTYVEPEDSLSYVVALMGSKNIKRAPVVDSGKLVGIVTRKDIIKAFVKFKKKKEQ